MKSNNFLVRTLVLLPLLVLPGCGGGGGSPTAAPTLVSITVTPANPSIVPGGSQQFTATGTFSNSTTEDLTTQVTWTSSGVVQISATGLAISPSSGPAGTATITATSGTVSGSTSLKVTGGSSTTEANVMAISVNGSLCSDATSGSYINKACVSVTVCNPGTSTCQTINDILLDTGSYGLRIFQQAISRLTLPQVPSGSGALAECIQFADLSSTWGPVKLADVQLGNEPAVQVPIQIIDATFASGGIPSSCAGATPDPATAGYTGILGVGQFREDCGSGCAGSAQNGIYYRCTGSSCGGTSVAIANQVQNPVASLPVDNNGVLVQLPVASLGGVPSLSGSLLLGIGTKANNTPASATVFPSDRNGDFTTVFNGVTSNGFLDTGSNGLFFPSALPICASPNAAWYCPPATTLLTATNVGATGSPSRDVQFNLGNFSSLFSSGNEVFSEIGGTSTFGFDWGLPFFMGRNVFIGINGKASGLGTGPYVAY